MPFQGYLFVFFCLFLICCLPLSSWVTSYCCIISATTPLQTPPKLFLWAAVAFCYLLMKYTLHSFDHMNINMVCWTLFWNAMRNFYIDDVIKSISFGLLTQICHRAKENESPFRRLEQGLLGCSQQGLPVSSENSWQTLCLVLSLYMKHMLWVCWGFCSSSLRDPDSGLQSLSAYVHVGVEHLPSQWLNVSECRCGKVYVSTENQI